VNQQDSKQDAVVLLHGIWMGGWSMRSIARYLEAHGFKTYCFSYQSVRKSPQQNARLLAEFVSTLNEERIHFVAHSLGGIVLMHYFSLCPNLTPGRAVIIGSPIRGSEKARRFSHWPFGNQALGESVTGGIIDGLDHACPVSHEVGVIAGTTPMGLGLLLGRFRKPNDGTVAVDETRIDGLTDHLVLPTSHTGMIFSRPVKQQIAWFLQHGKFRHE
jgi:pimeloyl-ACP methyl ester carboxylesterase